jgi:exodeoxyribonuclease V alpha subunit
MPRVVGELESWTAYGARGWGRGTLRVGVVGGAPRGRDGDAGATLTIVGVIPGARPGDYVDAWGDHEAHAKYGDQFVVERASLSAPQSSDAVVAWLVATLPNVGDRRARQLVARFGDDLWRVVEHEHERLTTVDGITGTRAAEIREAYLLASGDREAQVVLRSWGLTTAQIGRCVEQWFTADAAVHAIRQDPYALARSVDGFGWKRADEVARSSGLPASAPTRIAAAIDHALAEALQAGHVSMRPGYFRVAVEALLGPEVARPDVMRGIATALRVGRVVKRGARVYLARADRDEDRLAGLIAHRLGSNLAEDTTHDTASVGSD